METILDSSSGVRLNYGCVHGRFQPFHLGHLEFVARAYEQCKLLYVGIANSEPDHIAPIGCAPHRHRTVDNPFPYYARMEMVLGALAEIGADTGRLRVVPFPINRPELLPLFVPRSVTHLLTIYDAWGEHKLAELSRLGWSVDVMWRRKAKFTTGTRVRQLLRNGEEVSGLVPRFVGEYLEREGLGELCKANLRG